MTRTLACCALAFATAPALAQGQPADPAALDLMVEQFTGVGLGQPGGAREPVDRRLRLRPCTGTPQADWHGAPGRTVVLSCPDRGGWRVYVNLVSDTRQADRTARAAPAIGRGDTVTLVVAGPGFAIRRQGEALQAGAVGEWIAVRTVAGGDPVRARIVQPGIAEIPLR